MVTLALDRPRAGARRPKAAKTMRKTRVDEAPTAMKTFYDSCLGFERPGQLSGGIDL